jgi:diguanylate cyclase (GGDEF)-like protein
VQGIGASSVLINPRHAFAFGAAIASGLLLLQYAHRRKPFILIWTVGWLLIVPTQLLDATGWSHWLVARAAAGQAQLCRLGTAVMFFWSVAVFRRADFAMPQVRKFLVIGGVWFSIAPLVFGFAAVTVPGYVLTALIYAAAGTMYAAVLLERRIIGAGLTAFVVLGLAITNLSVAVMAGTSRGGDPFLLETLLANAVLYTFGMLGMHLLVFEDMTYDLRMINRRLELTQEELVQAAITDPLTGCHNRRFLDQVLDRELQRHARFKLPLSLLFIDIDRFKAINDSFGHDAGDKVLAHVAKFLKRHIREADYVFRYGGDEFLALITCTGEEANRKGQALKTAFDALPEAADLPPGLGLSVGTVEVPQETKDLAPLLREVDRRMYEDKHSKLSGTI